jgi:membrane-associated protease RseP (regulator of RpoE activity)
MFIAFAAGIVVPFWTYLLVLFACLLMPMWSRGHRENHPSEDGHIDHACGMGGHVGHDVARTPEDLAALRSLGDSVESGVFEVTGWEVTPAGFVYRGRLRASPARVQEHFAEVAQDLLQRSPQVMVHVDEEGVPYVLIPTRQLEESLVGAVPARRPLVSLALVAATLVTTTYAGAAHQGVDLLGNPGAWRVGLPYSLGVMLILGVHEMGHYLTARRHEVRVSLPYFIPIPFALGTFGAFISMPVLLKSRRQLFDIGVAGPLAGMVVAVPALALGLQWSQVLTADPVGGGGHMSQGVSVNSSMLLALVSKLCIGDDVSQCNYLVLLPIAFAGWLGLMITALNLLPVGQLDGGHIAHALFGRARAVWIGKVALGGMVVLGLFVWPGLVTWALIIYFVAGRAGLPPLDDVTPLDGTRRAVGWFAYGLLVLILLPIPHALSSTFGLHCPYL